MRRGYIYRLAIRNLVGHKLRSILTISGIAIGVGFIIFLISLGYGLQRISTQEVANLEALQIIEVTPGKSKIVKINDATTDKFLTLGNVVAAEPQLNLAANFQLDSSTIEGVVYGKNVEYLVLEEYELEEGVSYKSNGTQEIIINKALSRQLGYEISKQILGKSIKVSTNIGTEYLEEADKPVEQAVEYKVVGVMKSEDSPYAYVSLESYRKAGVVNYSSAKVKVDDKENTSSAKQQLENLGYKTSTLKDTVDQINQFFTIFQLILLSFGAIAVIIAALGMFNTLTISLLEKTREVSFMKILGTTSNDIWRLFIGEAILIGFIGAASGIILGISLGSLLNNFLINLAAQTGNKPVEIFYTPPLFIIVTFSVAMLISFLTGIYPSMRASKIDPLETMRYE